MSDLADRLAYKRELQRHLRELALLVGHQVGVEMLLSPEETRALRARASQIVRKPILKFEIPFGAKRESRFRGYIERLAAVNLSDVHLWTPASNVCGVLKPIALGDFDLGFPFDVNPEGIVTIITSDLCDQLLLDFSLANDGGQVLEVESSGHRWGGVAY